MAKLQPMSRSGQEFVVVPENRGCALCSRHRLRFLFFLLVLETTAPASSSRSPPTPAPKGFALHRRGTSQRTGMAAARHLRSGLPLIRAQLAASESAAVAQVPAPLSVVETDPFLSISIGLSRPVSDLGLPCLMMF